MKRWREFISHRVWLSFDRSVVRHIVQTDPSVVCGAHSPLNLPHRPWSIHVGDTAVWGKHYLYPDVEARDEVQFNQEQKDSAGQSTPAFGLQHLHTLPHRRLVFNQSRIQVVVKSMQVT
jgi:hypothetical protein